MILITYCGETVFQMKKLFLFLYGPIFMKELLSLLCQPISKLGFAKSICNGKISFSLFFRLI